MTDRDALKQAAGVQAAEWVDSGMVVGLGTGSTAIHAITAVGVRIAEGSLTGVVAIPTSKASADAAEELGIPLGSLADHPVIDLTIDGADEVDPDLRLIKGGGAALLHEKVVAQASLREVIVVDDAKCSERLGTRCALPVEVLAFGWRPESEYLDDLGADVTLRRGPYDEPLVTEEGNWILDAAFGPIADPERLAALLDRRAGVVAHGLFLGLATDLLVAGADGVEHRPAL
ncbi:MAG: ribose-5-phosphate isomerase RpiA [Actinobacteria bacterium]|nr:ribose-5-phosphate isomerase RpiA [Actinomycetota bacterium]